MNRIKLRNRTSEVQPEVTSGRIEKALAAAGVTNVSKRYVGGELVGLEFSLPTMYGVVNFRLPVKTNAAAGVMLAEAKRGRLNLARRERISRQAARTAWRLAQEWIEIQLSMVAMQQLELMQALLPYAVKDGQTLFDTFQRSGYSGLLAAPGEDGHK